MEAVTPGNVVRLVEEAAGMPAGSEGVLVGWFAREEREGLVRFWDGGPLRVPARVLEPVSDRARA